MQTKKTLSALVTIAILAVGVVFSPFFLGRLITSDGSLETVRLIVSSIISAFFVAVGIAVFRHHSHDNPGQPDHRRDDCGQPDAGPRRSTTHQQRSKTHLDIRVPDIPAIHA